MEDTMSIIKNPNLAESGRMKIAWVRDFMPALGVIGRGWNGKSPSRV